MKPLMWVLGAAACLLWVPAQAHGDAKPLYGGIVQVLSDMQCELVPQPDGALLYVVDHGEPADATRMSGNLTVLNGTRKSEAELKSAGGNKLQARDIPLGSGARVVASLRAPQGKTVTVRFAVK